MKTPKLGQALDHGHLTFLKFFATACRRTIIEMVKQSQSGHPGGSLSSIDYLSLLYAFVISQTGEKVLVSNGHISPAVYSVLAELGYIPKKEVIETFRQAGSIFEGHVTRHVPGVWYGTGPLGIGVSAAAGFAHAAKVAKSSEKVYALLGDGEAQEGQVYEMMHYANKYQLSNLIVFCDYNQIQLSGPLKEIMPIDIPAIFHSAHWNVIDVDGHNFQKLWSALHEANQSQTAPTLLLGRTLMGKGVDFMEQDSINNTFNWHGVAPSLEQADKALAQLVVTPLEEKQISDFVQHELSWKPPLPFVLEKNPPQIVVGKSKVLAADVKTDCRSAYGNALKELADLNPLVVAITADLGGSVKTDTMAKAHPERVFDTGIAEQHMVSASGGMSLAGLVPFCSTFGAFMTSRAKDQARVNDINRTNVKMVATHCGLSVGEDGPTHQVIDDLGSFLGFFHTTLLEPCDPNLCDQMIRYAAKTYGNFYVRMGRAKLPIITKQDAKPFYDDQYKFQPGRFDLLREGSELTFLAAGPMVTAALKALEKFGRKVELIAMTSLSHLDERVLVASLQKTKKCLTLEDHNPRTGYGQRINAFIAEKKLDVTVENMGVTEYQLSGKAEQLYEKAGLSEAHIEEKVQKMLQK